jgi:hypothetical protein
MDLKAGSLRRIENASTSSFRGLQHLVPPQVLNDRGNIGQKTYREQRNA